LIACGNPPSRGFVRREQAGNVLHRPIPGHAITSTGMRGSTGCARLIYRPPFDPPVMVMKARDYLARSGSSRRPAQRESFKRFSSPPGFRPETKVVGSPPDGNRAVPVLIGFHRAGRECGFPAGPNRTFSDPTQGLFGGVQISPGTPPRPPFRSAPRLPGKSPPCCSESRETEKSVEGNRQPAEFFDRREKESISAPRPVILRGPSARRPVPAARLQNGRPHAGWVPPPAEPVYLRPRPVNSRAGGHHRNQSNPRSKAGWDETEARESLVPRSARIRPSHHVGGRDTPARKDFVVRVPCRAGNSTVPRPEGPTRVRGLFNRFPPPGVGVPAPRRKKRESTSGRNPREMRRSPVLKIPPGPWSGPAIGAVCARPAQGPVASPRARDKNVGPESVGRPWEQSHVHRNPFVLCLSIHPRPAKLAAPAGLVAIVQLSLPKICQRPHA